LLMKQKWPNVGPRVKRNNSYCPKEGKGGKKNVGRNEGGRSSGQDPSVIRTYRVWGAKQVTQENDRVPDQR